MKKVRLIFLVAASMSLLLASAQETKKRICIDVGHGQRFWNDPNAMSGNAGNDGERVNYLNEELKKTLDDINSEIRYSTGNITSEKLEEIDLLVLHVPSMAYSDFEVANIQKYLRASGSLLLVMEADYWTSLDKTNVNKILSPFGISYGGNSADSLAGGYTSKSQLFDDQLKVTYQFGRVVQGGKPFVFNSQDDQPFGVYKELDNEGRLVVLGDAMSSLYMYEWRGVNDYQCLELMKGIYSWLLQSD